MKFGDFELGKYRFKQEEIGSTLLASAFWIWTVKFFDSFFLKTDKIFVMLASVLGIGFLWLLFLLSNRQTYKCYYLTRKRRAVMKAKILKTKVWETNGTSVYMMVRFKILETGEIYQWRESFPTFPIYPVHSELHQYLDSLLEISALVALDNHADNYPFIEVVFDEFVRQSQKVFRVLNVFWLLLLVVSAIYVFGTYFELL